MICGSVLMKLVSCVSYPTLAESQNNDEHSDFASSRSSCHLSRLELTTPSPVLSSVVLNGGRTSPCRSKLARRQRFYISTYIKRDNQNHVYTSQLALSPPGCHRRLVVSEQFSSSFVRLSRMLTLTHRFSYLPFQHGHF